MTSRTIGPEHGSLTVHTGVEGRAAKAGHRLTIQVRDWSATVTFDGPQPTAVDFRAALDSIDVVAGEGGLKPLSDRDKKTAKSSALDTLSADTFPEVTFISSSVTATDAGYVLDGQVKLHGTTNPVAARLSVQRNDGTASVEALVPLEQTRFGIKPYSGMMGTLKVSDRVEVRLSVTIAESN